jgi:hypothetical protein
MKTPEQWQTILNERSEGKAYVTVLEIQAIQRDARIENIEELIKAVFDAGFRIGRHNGEDCALNYERGSRSTLPQSADLAWKEDVQWRLEENSSYKMDMCNPTDWSSI